MTKPTLGKPNTGAQTHPDNPSNPLSKLRTLGLVSGQDVLEVNADLVG
jgi:hypothetical protein